MKLTFSWKDTATLNVQIVAEGHIAGRVLCSAGVHFAINQAHIGDPQRAWRQNTEPRKCRGGQGWGDRENKTHYDPLEIQGHCISFCFDTPLPHLCRVVLWKEKDLSG